MRLTIKQAWRVVAMAFDLASQVNNKGGKRYAMGMCYHIHQLHDHKLITKRVKDEMLAQIDAASEFEGMYLFPLDRNGDIQRRDFAEDRA